MTEKYRLKYGNYFVAAQLSPNYQIDNTSVFVKAMAWHRKDK